ncbi:hypothetical protein HD806DRAFT_522179 [Xylariaceae sp. AK1471]|nr:hypothetical protein HD806DRAFT_522179 [Xylariaceae sp. AK1471]
MGYSILATLQILSGVCVRVVLTQRLAYTSFAVTECVTQTASMLESGASRPSAPANIDPAPGKPDNRQGDPAVVTASYTMPPCIYCDCPSCTVLSSFTTAYPVFQTQGALGMKAQSYAVTETYVGLSSLPRFDQTTDVPFGFTTRLETCEVGMCGPEAITATMTYPAGGGPFVGPSTPTSGSWCNGQGSEGADDCSILSTQYLDTGTLETAAVPVPAPAQPIAVTAGGHVLQRPFKILGVFVLLTAAL